MKKILLFLSLLLFLFNSCQKNDEESEFLTFKNKRAQMEGVWEIYKVFGNGMDLTDTLNKVMPNIKFHFTDLAADDKRTALLYRFFYEDNNLVSGYFIVKEKKPTNASIQILWFSSYYSYGTERLFIPLLEKNQLDSLANNDTIVYDYYNSIYTNKFIDKNTMKLSCYTNKYQEIILRKL